MARDAPAPTDSARTRGEVVVPCEDFEANLRFFSELDGLRLDSTFPADDPRSALFVGAGLRVRLERSDSDQPVCLRLSGTAATVHELRAPNGSRIVFEPPPDEPKLPPLMPELVVTRASEVGFSPGRAGMQYRDLIPGRQGGRFIASHIRIADAGPVPVPDYVHYHEVRLQLIYCLAGWVRVVYEDQGEPFRLEPGDCVLQPPGIRHRVLECSAGAEVLELASPAQHVTRAEPQLELPTGKVLPERDYGGQRFVRHVAADARWTRSAELEQRDTGIAAATDGLLSVRVLRPIGTLSDTPRPARGELSFHFIFCGRATLRCAGRDIDLGEGDALVVPGALPAAFVEHSSDFEWLEVAVPARRSAARRSQ